MTIKVIAIVYVFARAVDQDAWWVCTAILEFVEIILVVVFTLVRGDSMAMEVVCVIPLTSQLATVLVTAYALFAIESRRSSRRPPWYILIHCMGVSLAVIAASVTAIALSATGNLPRMLWPHGILFMINSIVGYRPPASRQSSRQSLIVLTSGKHPSLALSPPALPQP